MMVPMSTQVPMVIKDLGTQVQNSTYLSPKFLVYVSIIWIIIRL